jgi:nucleotide-binding universal stress UspA family protein
MEMSMPIVCGSDFSDRSLPAQMAAIAMASRMQVNELWLVHVLDSSQGIFGEATWKGLRDAAEKRLAEQATRLQKHTTVHVRRAVLGELDPKDVKTVGEELMRFADAQKAAMLIVSSQGHGASPLHRIGGTSEGVVQMARLPVVVVRDSAPFEAWVKGERPLRVLLGIDATVSSDAAVRWVKALRSAGPTDVVVGHVYYVTDASRRYGIPRPFSILDEDPEIERLIARDLASRVGELPGTGRVTYRPKLGLGRLGDHLLDLADSEAVDLIVVGTHHQRGLRRLASISSVVLHYGHASVASIPTTTTATRAPQEMPRLKRVLIATDFSTFSNQAVAYGYSLLGDRGGEAYLVHVAAASGHRREFHEDTDLVAELRSLVPKLPFTRNIVTRTEVIHGDDAATAICEAAERLGVDAICVASHGRSGLKRALLGSVVEAVMHQATRPVLVVRPLPP